MLIPPPAETSNVAAKPDDDVYELPTEDVEIPSEWRSEAKEVRAGAVYELEQPARCPYCKESIQSLRVLRLTRTQVAFTSTLPRGGKVVVCPACDRILSAEVSGLL